MSELTGTQASAQIEEARQRQLDDFRKNAAYNTLSQTYGPAAGDPEAWAKLQGAKEAQDLEPGKVKAVDLANQSQDIQNQGATTDQQGVALYKGIQLFKTQAQPNADGSYKPEDYTKFFGNPAVQKLTGITPDQVQQFQPIITAPGGTDHLDAVANAALGPGKTSGSAVPVQNPDGSYGLVKFDQYGRATQPNLNGAQPASAVQGQERIELAREHVRQAAQNANVQLTPAGLELATQQFVKTGQMPAFGMGGTKNRVEVVNNAASQGATGEQIAGAAQNYKSAQAYETDLAKSSPTSAGGLARSAGAVFQHIDTLDQYVGALQNKNLNLANSLNQKFKSETGKAAPNTFDLQKTIVGDELARYLISRGGSGEDRKALQEPLNKAKSPQQLRDAIKIIRNDIGAQLYSQYSQAKGFGKDKQFLGILTPESRFILTGIAEPGLRAASPAAKTSGAWSNFRAH